MQLTFTLNQLVLLLLCGALGAVILYALIIYGRIHKAMQANSSMITLYKERLAQVQAKLTEVAADFDFIGGYLCRKKSSLAIEDEEMSIIDSFRLLQRALGQSGSGGILKKRRKGWLRRRRSLLSCLLRQWR